MAVKKPCDECGRLCWLTMFSKDNDNVCYLCTGKKRINKDSLIIAQVAEKKIPSSDDDDYDSNSKGMETQKEADTRMNTETKEYAKEHGMDTPYHWYEGDATRQGKR